MSYISLSQAFAQWQELSADIPKNDGPTLAESWNNYTDSLAKDGELCALQYHYAPAYDEPMPGDGSRFDPLADDRAFILERMGVGLVATFVPFSQSRSKGESRPSLNWRVALQYRGRGVIETDYTQGCGYAPAHKNPITFGSGKRDQWATDRAIASECETGRRTVNVNGAGHATPGKARIPPPDVVDVLCSLLWEARVLDCLDFADWCAELGMDTDSIKARAMYDACIAAALKLRGAFGEKTLSELHELFEGM